MNKSLCLPPGWKLYYCCLLLVMLMPAISVTPLKAEGTNGADDELSVMSWNIWHGGRENGDRRGPAQIAKLIKQSGADLIAVQETYGSGPELAEELGFHFHPRGTNVSILSRYEVIEDISVGEPFNCVGAIIRLPNRKRIAFYSIWLPFRGDIWSPGTRSATELDHWLAVCQPSADVLRELYQAIERRLSDPEYANLDVIIAGDFNSMSHLDYNAVNEDTFEQTVRWPTSQILMEAGFRDAYREVHPIVHRHLDATWSPRFPEQEQDRIDYIYYRCSNWRVASCRRITQTDAGFPSDHAAVLASFTHGHHSEQTELRTSLQIRAATYNIRHGLGLDGKYDLKRTADAIRRLDADVVGLQEVDMGTGRSQGMNQMRELASRLNMHAAFVPFMNFDGGRYGLGLLSRYPLRRTTAVDLPKGNEPRRGLLAELHLPDGRVLTVANLHFDWVSDDRFRWAQAEVFQSELAKITSPTIILGDFNARPGSRTIRMFNQNWRLAAKPEQARYTFPADAPEREIDFVYADRTTEWRIEDVSVADESIASDHRPVVVDLLLP